jgi:hypothetical protein
MQVFVGLLVIPAALQLPCEIESDNIFKYLNMFEGLIPEGLIPQELIPEGLIPEGF